MRREADHFGDQELSLIYVARKLNDALRLEAFLTATGVDYLVESDKYMAGAVFRTERVGAFFYVTPGDDEATRAALRQGGFTPFTEP
jgi:hypothetical protein